MFSRKSRALPFGLAECAASAHTNLEPGRLGKATIGGVYSSVLLRNSQKSVPRGTSLKVVGLQNATTFLVEVV